MGEITPSPLRRNPRRIDATAVHETIVRLEQRIAARFPESGLRRVAQELIQVARDATERIASIRRRSLIIRIFTWLLAIAILAILATIPLRLKVEDVNTVGDAVQLLESALGSSFFIGTCILFLVSMDGRMRRNRALRAIHELRAMAHVVDMHQLTKDPSVVLSNRVTDVSPLRTYSPFELARYLDYCSEMLALISKIAVLYVQDLTDPVAIDTVDDVEDLTTGLIAQDLAEDHAGAARDGRGREERRLSRYTPRPSQLSVKPCKRKEALRWLITPPIPSSNSRSASGPSATSAATRSASRRASGSASARSSTCSARSARTA
jgi:hypothetical protein